MYKITAFTFSTFWNNYHTVNPQYKLNISSARKLFESCNCMGKKKKLIQGIEKSKLSGLDYLKINL